VSKREEVVIALRWRKKLFAGLDIKGGGKTKSGEKNTSQGPFFLRSLLA
jgi:hypothetical protein